MSTQMVPMHSEEGENPSNGAFASTGYVRFGAFHLDLKKEELYKDGARVKLQGKVYQALVALLQKPGEIVRREDLRMQLWPSDTHVNYDAIVNTIPRQGYSFIAKIEYVDRPVAPLTSRLSEPAFVAATQERAASLFRT